MVDYKDLGMRVRTLRRKRSLTQEELAEQVGISASFMGHIERGSRVASLETVMQLCAVLGVTPNDLLEEEAILSGLELPQRVTLSPRKLLQDIALLLLEQENP